MGLESKRGKMYEKDREEIEKCTNLNASLFTDELNLNNINFITNSNDIKFEPWFIEDDILVVGVLTTQPDLYEKNISNMVECRSRGAYLMGLTTFGQK